MRERLSEHSLLRRTESEDVNPMEYAANLADIMLVFAVGLMLALYVYWSYDSSLAGMNGEGSGAAETSAYEVGSVSGEDSTDISDKSDLEQIGSIYVDPDTGKWYYVSNGD